MSLSYLFSISYLLLRRPASISGLSLCSLTTFLPLAYPLRRFTTTDAPCGLPSMLIQVAIICVLFMVAGFIGGWFSNSVATMTDAAHMLSVIYWLGDGIGVSQSISIIVFVQALFRFFPVSIGSS